jgi:hypothetical protein
VRKYELSKHLQLHIRTQPSLLAAVAAAAKAAGLEGWESGMPPTFYGSPHGVNTPPPGMQTPPSGMQTPPSGRGSPQGGGAGSPSSSVGIPEAMDGRQLL